MLLTIWATMELPRGLRADEPRKADLILLGDSILTMEAAQPRVEALAVSAGRILALGKRTDIMALRGDSTRIVHLKDRTLLPGFVDAHTHPVLSAMMGETADISGFKHDSRAAVIKTIRAAVAKAGKGDWVLAYGWDPAIVADLKAPTLKELDEIAPDNPLLIIAQTLHSSFANSRAFKAAGVTRDTPQPKGGYFEKDARGNLTGTVVEVGAMAYFRKATPKFPRAAYVYLLTNQMEAYARAGYTTITAPGLQPLIPEHLRSMRETAEHPDSPVNVSVYPLPKFVKGDSLERMKRGRNAKGPYRVLGPKLWIDGSPYAGGMAMREPYLNTPLTRAALGIKPGSRGHLHHNTKELNAAVLRWHRLGAQISAHVQGERAAAQFLDAVEIALRKFPRKDHRHRMEHNALVTPAQFQRAAQLGVTVSFYIDHVYYYGDALRESIVGPDRAARFMAMNAAKQAGHRVSLHTDSPSSPLGVFRAMTTAITRKTRSGKYTLGSEQGVSRLDALKAVTIHAAWQIFQEKDRGSLAPGKIADFTLVSRDPLQTPAKDWRTIRVLETWRAGQKMEYGGWTWRKISLVLQVVWGRFTGWFS